MIPERISPELLAAAVAARLDAVVPPGLAVRAEGTTVSVYDATRWPASAAAEIVTEDDGRSLVELAETAVRSILSGAQDEIMESMREQWPAPVGGARNAPDADARVIGDRLEMWFGTEASPVLRLAPVRLSELADGAA